MDVIEVVDVPEGASENEARRLLNRPCAENRYMLVQVLSLPDGGSRAFYRLLRCDYDKKPVERSKLREYRGNRNGMSDAALKIIRNNPDLSIRKLITLLEGAGITREKTWVSEARLAIRAGASKLAE
jgi:hypothetical protein